MTSSAYAKWTNGVVEQMNRSSKEILIPLCRHLKVEVNQWDKISPLVQSTLNRMPRKSRGGKSPIELTTTIAPTTAMDMLTCTDMNLQMVDDAAITHVQEHATQLEALLEAHWDLADTARRAKSKINRQKTAKNAIPSVDVGDYVLYAVMLPDTKLDYVWQGPGIIVQIVNRLICQVQPVGIYYIKPLCGHAETLLIKVAQRHRADQVRRTT